MRILRNYGQKHHNPYVSLPAQLFLGLAFFAVGALLLIKKVGTDYLPIVSEDVLVVICALGCTIGGMYMVIIKFHRPRIYL